MPRVRILTDTAENHEVYGFRRLPAGLSVDVDDATARRWKRNRIAEEWEGPLGVVTDKEAHASLADLQAERAKLDALIAQREAAPPQEASLPPEEGAFGDNPYADPSEGHPLDRYDFLSPEQKSALVAAGFASPRHLENASDEDVLEVKGVGPGTLRRIRGA